MARSHYSNDSGEYVPIVVAPRPAPRRRSPEEVHQNVFLRLPDQRPRAASTSGVVAPFIIGDYHHRRHHHRRRDSSCSSSDRSSRRSRRSRNYEYDNLPYELRKELDFAKEARAEERSRSRERRRRYEQERWEDEYEDRKRREQREKERIIQDAKDAEEKRRKEDDALRKRIMEEEEDKKKKKKKERELEEKLFEERVREKFKAAGKIA
jgi:hypothetical protein